MPVQTNRQGRLSAGGGLTQAFDRALLKIE